MTRIPLLLAVFATILCSCGRVQTTPLLAELDDVLENKEVYMGYFNDRVDVLRSVLLEQDDPEQIYNINRRMADVYKSHCFDSSLFYLHKNKELASELKDKSKSVETELLIVRCYTVAGYHAEAAEVYSTIDEDSITEELYPLYLRVSHQFYGEMSAYLSSDGSQEEKLRQRNEFRTKLLETIPEGSYDWYYLKREEVPEDDKERRSAYSRKMVEGCQVNTHDYARACYFYQEDIIDEELRKEWLIRSSIADVMCAVKDYMSLNTLSNLLFERGDIERAFRYSADHSMSDAIYFNGRLRQLQISSFFPHIEKAYNERTDLHMKAMTSLIIVVTCFLLILISLLIFIAKRQRDIVAVQNKLKASNAEIDERNKELLAINSKLSQLNNQMLEADIVKQEYIALFLSILSENINTTRQYKNHVLKNIRQGNTKLLVDEIESLPTIDEDITEFYKMFDQTFINLYPDFVEKFNGLLMDGAAIVPKGDDILTPELRIFALIKLGITDSSKIASLLHYSANTIYNYRAKTKNKAKGSREGFESAVRSIE